MKQLLLVWAAITPKQLQHGLVTAKNVAFLFLKRKCVRRKASASTVVR